MAGENLDLKILVTAVTKDAVNSLSTLSKSAAEVGREFQKIGAGLTAGLTVPLAALSRSFIRAGIDAEETANKFNVVFRQVSDGANQAADDLRNNFGLSLTEAQSLLADTGDLLSGFGFQGDFALDISNQVQQLAVDLASFTNFSGGAAGASAALTKALLGERESIKSLGIAIQEADVNARVLANTQRGLTFETERQARAVATLQLAQEQSQNAIGDFARSQDSLANTLRVLRARFNDLAREFGTILLPTINRIVGALTTFANFISTLPEPVKVLALQIGILVASIGPLLLGLGTLLRLLPLVVAGFTALTSTVTGLVAFLVANPLIAILAVPLGIIAKAVVDLNDTFGDWGRTFQAIQNELAIGIGELVLKFAELRLAAIETINRLPGVNINTDEAVAAIDRARATLKFLEEDADAFADTSIRLRIDQESLAAQAAAVPGLVQTSVNNSPPIKIEVEPVSVGQDNISAEDSSLADIAQSQQDALAAQENLERQAEAVNQRIGNSISNNLVSGLNSFVDGTKSAGEAFDDFASGVINNILDIIQRQLIANAVASAFSGAGGVGGATAGAGAGFAEGGFISGPGSGTSDSVNARLSAGEFVVDAATTKTFGAGFFKNLQQMARGASNFGIGAGARNLGANLAGLPTFQTGGFVSTGNSTLNTRDGAPMVEIINNGTAKDGTVTTFEDVRGPVIQVVLDDVARNGPISKSLTNAFGVRRGGKI